jgi:hypothetical protein
MRISQAVMDALYLFGVLLHATDQGPVTGRTCTGIGS